MKPLRHALLADAVPLERGPGERTPQTLLLIDERDELVRAAARFFGAGLSDRELARRLRHVLSVYREGRWRRDRSEPTCPTRHRGRLDEVLWMILKTRDAVPSERLLRLVLSRRNSCLRRDRVFAAH